MSTLLAHPTGAKRIGTIQQTCTCDECQPTAPDDRDWNWEAELELVQAIDFETVDVGPTEPAIPLADWLAGEAAFYLQDDGPVSEIVGERIRQLSMSCRFYGCQSVAELVAASSLLKRCNLEEPIVAEDRRTSVVADLVDCEAAGYLLPGQGEAARVVAWILNDLAEQCEDFHAKDVPHYLESLKKHERAEFQAFMDANP